MSGQLSRQIRRHKRKERRGVVGAKDKVTLVHERYCNIPHPKPLLRTVAVFHTRPLLVQDEKMKTFRAQHPDAPRCKSDINHIAFYSDDDRALCMRPQNQCISGYSKSMACEVCGTKVCMRCCITRVNHRVEDVIRKSCHMCMRCECMYFQTNRLDRYDVCTACDPSERGRAIRAFLQERRIQ